MGARQHSGGHGRGRAPVALRCGSAAQRFAHEGLARRTDEHRSIERGCQRREPCQHTITVVRLFGKPEAPGRRSCDAASTPRAAATARLASSSAVTSATTSWYTASAYIGFRSTAHVHEDERDTGRGDNIRKRGLVP